MPADKDSVEFAKYLLYLKLIHDGSLLEEDQDSYEHLQMVYGYSLDDRLTVQDWWDTLALELDCDSADELECESPQTARMVADVLPWPRGAFAEWQKSADSETDSIDGWFARVMLRIHRADTSSTVEDSCTAWSSLQALLSKLALRRIFPGKRKEAA